MTSQSQTQGNTSYVSTPQGVQLEQGKAKEVRVRRGVSYELRTNARRVQRAIETTVTADGAPFTLDERTVSYRVQNTSQTDEVALANPPGSALLGTNVWLIGLATPGVYPDSGWIPASALPLVGGQKTITFVSAPAPIASVNVQEVIEEPGLFFAAGGSAANDEDLEVLYDTPLQFVADTDTVWLFTNQVGVYFWLREQSRTALE